MKLNLALDAAEFAIVFPSRDAAERFQASLVGGIGRVDEGAVNALVALHGGYFAEDEQGPISGPSYVWRDGERVIVDS